MRKLLFLLPVLILLSNCSKKQTGKEISNVETRIETLISPTEHLGEKLMKQQCYACHNPATSIGNRTAPPMVAIRKHYIQRGMSQEDFTSAIVDYVKNPSEEKSLMPGAVQRFGVMPQMVFKEEDLFHIATYLFENEPQKPDWFDEHFDDEHSERKGEGRKRHRKGQKWRN